MSAQVRIHVVTYRRPHLLDRALRSIKAQTYTDWVAEVINDDPSDLRVHDIIKSINDDRIFLSIPSIKRGGTDNFNYAFRKIDEPFACILEDDNWYEPDFLEIMIARLTENIQCELAVANELIWSELPNNEWKSTKRTIWDKKNGETLFYYKREDKAGQAKICNSSMLWKTTNSCNWLTPKNIPIDVTEHFRERVIPHPVLLIYKPLVNYSETLQTYRKGNEMLWSIYQTLLISSIFKNLSTLEADELAETLWIKARTGNKLYRTALLNAAFAYRRARVLFKKATAFEFLRYVATFLRRPREILTCIRAINAHPIEWQFLIDAQT